MKNQSKLPTKNKAIAVNQISVGVVNNNVAPDFDLKEDIHISVRLNYYMQMRKLPPFAEYLRKKISISFLN